MVAGDSQLSKGRQMAAQSISTECFVMPETRGQSQKRDILDCDCMLQFAKVPCSGDGTMRKADCNFSFFPCNSMLKSVEYHEGTLSTGPVDAALRHSIISF